MRIELKDIGPDGRRFVRHLDAEATWELLQMQPLGQPLDLEPMEGPAEVDLDLLVYRAEEAVIVQGSVRGALTVSCGRCLGPCTICLDEPETHLTFLPPRDRLPEEEELSAEDLDTAFHDGEAVELGPVVREQLLLAVPITPLCSEACRGLCPKCGINLNESACGCEPDPVLEKRTPWAAALADLKKDNPGHD